MIDGLPRSASVVAMRDCVLRIVIREAFQQRANTKSETHQVLLAILARRLREVDEDLAANLPDREGRVTRALLTLAEYIGQPSSEGHIVFQEDHPGPSCGDGRSGAGKCESRFERVAAAQFRDWILAPPLS
jgi:CRP-like cAMP-binding protein